MPLAEVASRSSPWRLLAHHVEPLARAFINRAVSDSDNVTELYRRLAEHIPSEPARRPFLDGFR